MNNYSWNICDKILDSPHVLIAGTTGSGKSVFLNSIIFSAINGRGLFYFIDLKRVEMSRYKNLNTTLGLATEPYQVKPMLEDIVFLMDDRYSHMKGVKTKECPIYVVIDELADLTYSCSKECLDLVVKIGRLGRAANIHLICATQDPSKKTLSAQLMQNFTTRIALRCFSPIESRQIIGVAGAETLPQHGFALLRDASGVRKVQVPFTPEDHIQSVVEENSSSNNEHCYDFGDMFDTAYEVVKRLFKGVFVFLEYLFKILFKLTFWRL